MEELRLEEVERALAGVLDPCSRMNGSDLSFVELGMIDEVRLEAGGVVHVRLFLDDPLCLYITEIYREIRDVLLDVPGVTHVEMSIVADRIWTEADATEEAREKLRVTRENRRRYAELRRTGLIPVAAVRRAAG